MNLFIKKELNVREVIPLILVLFLSAGFQLLIIKVVPGYSMLFLMFLILILVSIALYSGYVKEFTVYLIILNFIPLLILDNEVHYNFILELLSFSPLFLLIIFAVFKYILRSTSLSVRIGYLELPILLIFIYFGISALIAVFGHRDTYWIVNEFFHFGLYLTIFPISYLIRERDNYFVILKTLLLISILISIQYIIFNIFIYGSRFVTFQSNFIPLTVGVVFAYFLLIKSIIKKLGAIILLFVLIAGTIVTLTRTLWVTSFLVLLASFVIYLIIQNKITLFRTILVLLTLIIPILILKDSFQKPQVDANQQQSVQYRTKSISKPLEDVSFLMRVELGYYAIQKFLTEPIFGAGIGDFVKYKITTNLALPIYYLDSTWLYVLWKGGIIGFIFFSWLYFRFFKATYFVLKNTKDINVKIIYLGLLGGFLGLTLLGLLSPLHIKYKTNALIAFLFAYVEFEREKIAGYKYLNN